MDYYASCPDDLPVFAGLTLFSTALLAARSCLDGSVVFSMKARLEGSKPYLLELAALFGWLTAASQNFHGRCSSIGASLIKFGQQEPTKLAPPIFEFDFGGIQDCSIPYPCWLPLFRSLGIVSGFDLPIRTHQRGLELSFDHMVSLCCVEYPLERDGKIILVGLSAILLPADVYDDGSIQWHLIVPNKGSLFPRLLADLDVTPAIFTTEYIRNFATTVTSSESHFGEDDEPRAQGWPAFVKRLRDTRHFLGWCKNVNVLLGTPAGQYAGVTWTKATEKMTRKTPSSDSFTLGASGKGIISAAVSRSYAISQNRDQRYPLANRASKFEATLHNHSDEQVILYEPDEGRGWLVPFLSVLLHMIILRLKRDGYRGALPFARPSWDGSSAALKALMSLRDLRLGDASAEKEVYKLEDLATLLIFALQNAYPAKASTTISGKVVFGHELMDLVTCEPPFRVKRSSVTWSHGGWPYLTRDVQIVLFCRGLGEALLPSDTSRMCSSWKTVPKGANFLAATTKGLRHLAARAGYSDSCDFLMEGYKWFCPPDSFNYRCETVTHGAHGCSCEPLQCIEHVAGFRGRLWPRFVKRGGLGSSPSNIILQESAVVFGDRRILRKAKELATALEEVLVPSTKTLSDQSSNSSNEDLPKHHLETASPIPQQPDTPPAASVQLSAQCIRGLSLLASGQGLQRWNDCAGGAQHEPPRQENSEDLLYSSLGPLTGVFIVGRSGRLSPYNSCTTQGTNTEPHLADYLEIQPAPTEMVVGRTMVEQEYPRRSGDQNAPPYS
jgi:hypothetical protein